MKQERRKLPREYATEDKKKSTADAQKKQRDYAFSSSGLAYRAHVYCVFTDPDFQLDIVNLRSQIEKLYYPDISLETSYYDEHILQIDRESIKKVADKYRITLGDLGFFADGYFNIGYSGFGKDIRLEGGFKFLQPLETENLPVYVIGKYTTLEDIRQDWAYIKDMVALKEFRESEESARKRSPDNPELIYAVFKARTKNTSFKAIFELYEYGDLHGYKGSRSQFKSEDSLERYYRKYAPKPIDNNIDSERHIAYIREIQMRII